MDAAQVLAPYQAPWKPALLERAEALPSDLGVLVRALVNNERDHQRRTADLATLADVLHGGGEETRRALASVFFPQFPDTARRTLGALLTRHPYPQGYERRAFRAPGHRLHADRAVNWLWATWHATRDYPQDLAWFAVHTGHLPGWHAHGLGLLFAQALDDGDETIFGVLRDTAGTQHPVARMGRHVPHALLASARPDAWDLAEGLLLAAQRQEGLRQVILETVDEAHPDAFARFLRLILREDLLRFAACLRAADVWFGLGYDVTDTKAVRGLLERALAFLEDTDSARAAVRSGGGVDAYLALFTLAFRDAGEAATLARPLLQGPDPERRMAAVQFLSAAQMLGNGELGALLADPDVRLGALAAGRVNRWQPEESGVTFGALEGYAARLGGEATNQPLLFPWLGQVPARAGVLDLLPALLGERPFTALTPHLAGMSGNGKSHALRVLRERGEKTPLDPPTRALLMTLLQDRTPSVAEEAVGVAAHLTLAPGPEEAEVVHGLLKRRSADLRRGLIRLLARDPGQASASAARLLATRNTEQRQAGLQLLLEVGGGPPAGFRPANTTEETLHARLTHPESVVTLDDGLGLFDPEKLAPLPTLQAREHDYAREMRRGADLLKSLDDLIHAHREDPLTGTGWDGRDTVLLGNVSPWMLRGDDLPLADLWRRWWVGRTDPQPGDLTRMGWALGHFAARRVESAGDPLEDLDDDPRDAPLAPEQALRHRTLHRMFGPPVPLWLEHAALVRPVVAFLVWEAADGMDTDLALDAWETGLGLLPRDVEVIVDPVHEWHRTDPRDLLAPLRPTTPREGWTPEQWRRLWELSVCHDRAFPKLPRQRPDAALLIRAEEHGWATHHDLLDTLIGPRSGEGYARSNFPDLHLHTARKPREGLPTSPAWQGAVDAVRERVLEVELTRGDLETPATGAALSLGSLHGAGRTLRLLAGLGKNPLRRSYLGHGGSRDTTFSHLIRVSFPAPVDTPATFAREARALGVKDARLLDLAMFAPQWAPLVEATLGWKGLGDGVYWLHAHTKDGGWSVPGDVREAWEAEIGERTPLSAQTLTEGAVDVAWFRRMHGALGAAHFTTLLGAARYASGGGGHKRAELFARALLGELNEEEVRTRITGKRHGDAVRALGLLPLSRKKTLAAREVEGRYRLLADFRREARQFGAQRQASERLAADIGMQNLARTAGYADPQRLTWAMEARLAPDWSREAEVDGVTVGIDLTPDGAASLRVRRGDKTLKNLPPAVKKHAEVVAIRTTLTELDATRTRMRAALEEAMVRGDHFGAAELRDLARHPVIAPMLRSLVWVLGEGGTGWWQGDALRTPDGELPIGEQALRLAHPHDLFVGGQWPAFQEHVMAEGVTQPFKQVFREYYPLTPAEGGGEARRSTRYDGHHVQPTKAAALLKTRGWVPVPEEGVRKTDHAEGINVWVDTFVGGPFTPNEVEGTPLRAVYFVRRDEREALPLSAVPPRLFSETMRDLDLVVSVAHVGGVDPEASQSTVEMRESLLRETLRLLGLRNVRLEHGHALIAGHHANYTVHLGSGTVHRQPGGFLCIIPVHNAQGGRIFLPFADPDPRTAEVVSKVLLLAEDRKIQDPTILEQLA
ncbi:DUF5724 domain-containing protein [Deinococcus sp. YIM 134068]|uniref:DUF5724 domain-containing protein n=1 Tax=Deinococcus lichenicola TaxID=3118910 RepID=UPI002F95B16C